MAACGTRTPLRCQSTELFEMTFSILNVTGKSQFDPPFVFSANHFCANSTAVPLLNCVSLRAEYLCALG